MATNPIRDVDLRARALVQDMVASMRHAILSVYDAANGYPHLSRIAAQADRDGVPMALLSEIAAHTHLLEANPRAGLLIEATQATKGDAMAQPRMTLQVVARRLPRDGSEHAARLDRWIAHNPKARAYAQLPDFHFWRLEPHGGLLNAGFGQAYYLQPADLKKPPTENGRGE
ncbi:HugZ family pyridoxamine 5'-phosphate oxidase [Paracoccus xiamenensis]|uniref:HugZ family pyridoxamine 5'-phosphate oxidase n=1 Tax=Paracoccus xiamenensis TaxID=2714901 RepID=UPI00140B1DE3|nr:pyridoxamine 5-phosphate oxidase [Paracoccus xiamenensis]NHF72193.1 pyridoxamine 5-phosphate oxidase [Paracoccus xiamenensis]